jgi:hypothetical protein
MPAVSLTGQHLSPSSKMYLPKLQDPAKRIDLVLQVICLAMGVLVFLSHPLWLSQRNYPMAPRFSWMPGFAYPWDAVVAGLFIVLPFLIFFSRSVKTLTVTYVILYIILVIQDQNRLQPYYFQLLAMLVVVSGMGFGKHTERYAVAFRLLGIILFGTYLWAGIHKVNPYFQARFAVLGAGYWVPVVEILLALGLLWPLTRRVAVAGLVLMHIGIAVALSPWFYGWNLIVIPWNLALAAINVLVFWPAKESGPEWFSLRGLASVSAAPGPASNAAQRRALYAARLMQSVLILLFVLLPALNLFGHWDHYLSSSLYSYKVPYAKVYLEPEHVANLPDHIEKYVFDDDQGVFVEVTLWALGEMQTAPYPEHRVHEQIRSYLCGFSPADSCSARLVVYRD